MFTGLVEKTGTIRSLTMTDHGRRLVIEHSPWETAIEEGESISVQGACLTAVKPEERLFNVDLLQETVDCTNFGELEEGASVNLERALAVGDRLGGHYVTGHIDGTAILESVIHEAGDVIMTFRGSDDLLLAMVPKGSVAIDGVSLTVASLQDDTFSVCLIPHTLEITSLSALKAGRSANIETDLIGKHVTRFMESRLPKQAD